jgi:hypothetical protein
MANRFGEDKDVDIRADDPLRPDWERDAKEAAELAEDAGVKAGQAVGKAAGEATRKLRRSPSARLYSAVPMLQVWPSSVRRRVLSACMALTASSRMRVASGRSE